MSTIKIGDLQVFGSDLFADNESYLTEIEESSLLASQIQGGSTVICSAIVSKIVDEIVDKIMEPTPPQCPPPPPNC